MATGRVQRDERAATVSLRTADATLTVIEGALGDVIRSNANPIVRANAIARLAMAANHIRGGDVDGEFDQLRTAYRVTIELLKVRSPGMHAEVLGALARIGVRL